MIYNDNGELWGFGDSENGQLGIGNNINQYEPIILMQDKYIKQICCGGYYSMILKDSGELLVFVSNYFGQLGFPLEDLPTYSNLKDWEPHQGYHSENIDMPTLLMIDKKLNRFIVDGVIL